MVVPAGDDAREEGAVCGWDSSEQTVCGRLGVTQSLNPAWVWSRGPVGLCGLDPCGERRWR